MRFRLSVAVADGPLVGIVTSSPRIVAVIFWVFLFFLLFFVQIWIIVATKMVQPPRMMITLCISVTLLSTLVIVVVSQLRLHMAD